MQIVGEVAVTPLAKNDLIFSWRLNGHHGSDRLKVNNPETCPIFNGVPTDMIGLWRPSGVREGGMTAILTANNQAWIRYYFDRFGVPRWVIATDNDAGPDQAVFALREFRGFCPYCPTVQPDFEFVGVFERELFDDRSGREIIEFVTRPPLDTVYATDRLISRLGEVRACP